MKNPNHERIYLIPGSYDGEHCYVWSGDPAPGSEDNTADAIEYVRADLAQSNEMLARRANELTGERDTLDVKSQAILISRNEYFKKCEQLAAQLSEQSKVIEHIATAVGEESDPMACWEAVDALIHKAESLEQEAKIHASELDTQKSIVRDLCNLFGLRVHDYHCISKVKEAIEETKAQAVEDCANSLITGSVANHWCEKEQSGFMWCHSGVLEYALQLRQSAKAGD